jgi:Pet100
MAKGKQGFALEVWKFGVYLMIPVGASIYWNDPDRQKRNTEYWQVRGFRSDMIMRNGFAGR